jgi:NAD dependent epimerase/dehydratase family enzyme
MSWISLVDIVGAIQHCLTHEELTGPVNGTAPNPVTNAEFTKTLGEVLGRPTFLSIPAVMARIAFGEMADEMLIGGCRVLPNKLQSSGYRFHHPWLRDALEHAL